MLEFPIIQIVKSSSERISGKASMLYYRFWKI